MEEFKSLIEKWDQSEGDLTSLRTEINKGKRVVREIVLDCSCLKLFTLAPPAAFGGFVRKNVDAFDLIFEKFFDQTFTTDIKDMLDETIGVLKHNLREGKMDSLTSEKEQLEKIDVMQKNFAFIVMAIDPARPELEDVLNAIKGICRELGIKAERIDDDISNERITDRILDAIRKAEFVIVDITDRRPNVFYEAGYAHGFGKLPIYIAREGTALDFDIKDYPVIFFKNLTALKTELAKRLNALKK